MDAYAETFDFVEAGGVFAVPPDHVPHASLALKTFHSGVRVEPFPDVVFGDHRNASRMRPSEVEALLRRDLQGRALDRVDEALLAAAAG